MNLRIGYITLLATGMALMVSSQAIAQQIQVMPLLENPFRDDGGSCVYDRAGKLVHQPRGKDCRDRSDRSDNSDISDSEATNSLVAGFAPALQADLRQLLRDHAHISKELTQLRQTVQAGARAEALELADQIEVVVAQHRRREEAFLAKLSKQRRGR